MIGPTIHNENPFGDCPLCGSTFFVVDLETSIIGRTENGDPVPYYTATFRCHECGQNFFMEGRSMDAIRKQWEYIREECAQYKTL